MTIPFFDCNVRLGKASNPKLAGADTAAEVLAMLELYEVERALVFHKETLNDPRTGNELLIREIAGYPRLVGCAVLAPVWSGEFGDIATYFDDLRAHRIRAVRLFPRIHNYPLQSLYLDTVLQQTERCGMPVILDEMGINDLPISTWGYSPDYSAIYALAQEFPRVQFIVLLPGMLTQRMLFTVMVKCANVSFECSSFGYKNIEYVCAHFGADKLLYGSYFPLLEPGAFISYLMYADIPNADKECIAARNLERLLAGGGA